MPSCISKAFAGVLMVAFFVFVPNFVSASTTTPDITFAPSTNWAEWIVRYLNETGRGQTFRTGPTTTAFRSVALKLCRVTNFTKPKTLTLCTSAVNGWNGGCQNPLASKTYSASDLNAMIPYALNCPSNLEGGPEDGFYYKWVNFTFDTTISVNSSANYFFLFGSASASDIEPVSVLEVMYNNCNYLGSSQNYPDGQTYSYRGSTRYNEGALCDMLFKTYSSDPAEVETIPTTTINNMPTLSFSTSSPNGINTSTIFLPYQPTFKISYLDQDNDAPREINVVVNSTTYPMSISQPVSYVSGTVYSFTAPTGTFAKGDYSYYFEANDGKVTTTVAGGPFRIKNVPVILVPGIAGTELARGNDILWLNLGKMLLDAGDQFMDALMLDSNGNSIDVTVTSNDVLRKPIIIFDYFDGLIREFNSSGYNADVDLFVFPYDWRLDNISTAQKLRNKVDSVISQTGSNRVNLMVHSMGGLVVKQYILDNGSNKINKLIFLGTPQLGAPGAFKTLVGGDNFGIPFLDQLEIKKLAQNMSSVYQLLPSKQYFQIIGGYFFDGSELPESYDRTTAFLVNQGSNGALADNARIFHSDQLDNFFAPAGVPTYNIVGCDTPTIGKIVRRKIYVEDDFSDIGYVEKDDYDLKLVIGDGTVPLSSATAVGNANNFYVSGADHAKMPSQDGIRQLITKLVTDSAVPLPSNVSISINECHLNWWKIISFHSPVNPHVYDASGNHVGLSENGVIDEDIPGARYEEINGDKFVFLPEQNNQNYTVKIDATATGTFSMRVSTITTDTIQQTVFYNDIPIIPASQGQIEVNGQSNDNTLQFDKDGTNNFVPLSASSVLDAVQAEDYVKPTTTISVAGIVGNNGWYLSTTTISLSAIDDNSDILKTEYSLDNGKSWQANTIPFVISEQGTSTIKYKSIDRAGNKEVARQMVLHIDTEAPEATIVFDPFKKDISVIGEDNLSLVEISNIGSRIVLSDQAGNTTALNFAEKNRRDLLKANLLNIQYDGVELKILNQNRFQFNWANSKQGNLNELQQEMYSDGVLKLKTSYIAKQNLTIIHEVNSVGDTVDEKLNGLVLIKIETKKGNLNYNY